MILLGSIITTWQSRNWMCKIVNATVLIVHLKVAWNTKCFTMLYFAYSLFYGNRIHTMLSHALRCNNEHIKLFQTYQKGICCVIHRRAYKYMYTIRWIKRFYAFILLSAELSLGVKDSWRCKKSTKVSIINEFITFSRHFLDRCDQCGNH